MKTENEAILTILEKYETYFKLWNAGVALGIKGDHIFYEMDEKGRLDTFLQFKTAEQLEAAIIGTMAHEMTCILGIAADNLSMCFSRLEQRERKSSWNVTDSIPLLAEELAAIRREYRQWSGKIGIMLQCLEHIPGSR